MTDLISLYAKAIAAGVARQEPSKPGSSEFLTGHKPEPVTQPTPVRR